MFEVFWKALSAPRSPTEAKRFWQSFISDVEQIMLAKRFAIALMLAKGYLYQDIKDTLKVSSSTIMDVGIRYKIGGGGIKPALKKILKDEKINDFMDNLEEFLIMLSPPGKYGSPRHQERQQQGLKLYKSRKKREKI